MYATRGKTATRYRTTEKLREQTAHIRYIQEVCQGKHAPSGDNCNATGKYYKRWLQSIYESTKPMTKDKRKHLNKLEKSRCTR